jgi:hypothetical protein
MAGVPSGADGEVYLTPGELEILADVERGLSWSDPRLADALSTCVRPVPGWLIGIARFALLMIAPILLLPFAAWSSIVGITTLILVTRLLRRAVRS